MLFYLYFLIRVQFRIPGFDGNDLNHIIIVFAIVSLISLAYCYFAPWLMLKGYLSNKRKPPVELDSRLFSLYIVQSSTLEAIAVWGLMLGILGGSIYIVIVFFIVAVAGLIITFPTRNRWERLSVRIKPETGENNS